MRTFEYGENEMEMFDILVCPTCKKSMQHRGTHLICKFCDKKYEIIENIPIFVEDTDQLNFWNNYGRIRQQEPFEQHDYYPKFAKSTWNTLLDLGSADGVMSAGAASKVKHVYCLDPSLYSLKLLKMRKLRNLNPVCGISENLPFSDNFFDGVFNIFVIEHLKTSIPFLKEIFRVLKPNGSLVISTDTKFFDRFTRFLLEFKKKGLKS